MDRFIRSGSMLVVAYKIAFSSFDASADDRFSWSSNVWVQPTWSSSWGDHHSYYGSGWRRGIGIGTGSPYWNNHSYYWNRYRPYWRYDDWRYPYRYQRHREQVVERQAKVIAPLQQTTTSMKYSSDIKSLPANARVIQRDNRTIYEWQGIEYVYDWQQQSYLKINE